MAMPFSYVSIVSCFLQETEFSLNLKSAVFSNLDKLRLVFVIMCNKPETNMDVLMQ